MNSDEVLAEYRALSVKYQVDPWLEPAGLPGHLLRLQAILDSDTVCDDYPEPFCYNRQTIPDYATDWLTFLRDLHTADMRDSVRTRVLAEVEVKLRRADALGQENDVVYVEVERNETGLPSTELVEEARDILKGDLTNVPFSTCPAEPGSVDHVSSSDVRSRMRAALDAYGLDEWQVVEEPNMTARASVNGPLHRVRVRAGTRFTERSADRLLAHEVGGHVLRWANSQHQPEAWVSVALGQTVPTEEGMAAWREVEFGLQAEEQLRVYAARVLAVDAAERMGLVGVARLIQPYVGADHAAEIAIRTKRGLLDPNGPGGQTKDWGYLAGLWSMADLARHRPDSLRLMASVKWPLDDLALVEELCAEGRVTMPERLPDARKLGLHEPGLSQ